MSFSGLGMNLGNLSLLSNAVSRSISPENFTGDKGKGGMSVDGPAARQARDLGPGWKISPYVKIDPGTTFTLADIEGQGAIQQIWMTISRGRLRHSILRVYWDDQAQPSIECPVGDFFACGWEEFAQVSSLAVCVNPGRGFNCYWEMPFRKRARVTLENRSEESQTLYYQINYALTDVPADCAYFHAQFRRTNPVPYKQVHTILDGIAGRGHYVGTYMAWGSNNNLLVGRRRDQVLSRRRRRIPHHLRHRHRGLFLRGLQFRSAGALGPRQPRPDGRSAIALPRIHHALYRPAAGDPARRRLQVAAAFRHVPLAHSGSRTLSQRSPRNDAGAGLALRRQGATISAAAGRCRIRRVLVPDAADRAVPKIARRGLSRG
jgi:hypothetical protein